MPIRFGSTGFSLHLAANEYERLKMKFVPVDTWPGGVQYHLKDWVEPDGGFMLLFQGQFLHRTLRYQLRIAWRAMDICSRLR